MPVSLAPRTWPWWLWIEHGLMLGFVSWKSFQAWKASRRTSGLQQSPISKTPQEAGDPTTGVPLPSSAYTKLIEQIGSSTTDLSRLPRVVLGLLERIKALAGPKDVLSWQQVHPAPVATMNMTGLADGETAAHHDNRGSIYKFKLAEGIYVNMYFTKAGFRRSGDLHDCNQYDVVLQGRTRLRMIDPHTGAEVVQEYGANDFIVIPARTPHMFEFLEDNYLLEWWDDSFKAWYYKPYRSIIEQGLPLSSTDGRDFSLHLAGQK